MSEEGAVDISQFRFPFSQCRESLLCEGCDKRFSKSNRVYVQNRSTIQKIAKHHMICNKDYVTYERQLLLDSPEQTFYEVHFVHELDRMMSGGEREDIIPASHNIMIKQFLTYKEALESTEFFKESDMPFIIYEKSYRHAVLESHLWGRTDVKREPSVV